MATSEPNSANQRRTDIRQQLFSGLAKKANTQGVFKTIDEEEWLVPNWATYVKLNFELPDPGPEGCLSELRKMIADKATPHYQGGKKGGKAKPIKSRPLGNSEHAKLRELLKEYDKKHSDICPPNAEQEPSGASDIPRNEFEEFKRKMLEELECLRTENRMLKHEQAEMKEELQFLRLGHNLLNNEIANVFDRIHDDLFDAMKAQNQLSQIATQRDVNADFEAEPSTAKPTKRKSPSIAMPTNEAADELSAATRTHTPTESATDEHTWE